MDTDDTSSRTDSPPLPWFLGEPATYPEAAPLAIAVLQSLLDRNVRRYESGQLVLSYWSMDKCFIRQGISIQWQGKLVLLAPDDGDVWVYRAGTEWEEALSALDRGSEEVPAADVQAQSSGFGPASDLTPPEITTTPAWTGGATMGRVMEYPQSRQDVIDASTMRFRQGLRRPC